MLKTLVVLASIVGFLVLMPSAWLIFGSFWSSHPASPGTFTLSNYFDAYSDPITYSTLATSLIYAGGATAISFAWGLPLAWLVTRTNLPFRRFFTVVGVLPYMIPGILFTISWIFLASPGTGVLNVVLMQLFGLKEPPLNIFSMPGMIWVDGLAGAPLVSLLLTASLSNLDASYEEAAKVSGAPLLQIVRKVTYPMLRPAILAALTLSFIRYMELFESPALLGIPSRIYVFTTQVYRKMASYNPEYGTATSVSITLLLITAILVYLYRSLTRRSERFTTITGKGMRASLFELGRWRYPALALPVAYFLLAGVMPLVMLVLGSILPRWGVLNEMSLPEALSKASFKHFNFVLSFSIAQRAFLNSILLALIGPTVCMLLVSFISYANIWARRRGVGVLEFLSFMPFSFPGIVIGVGLLWAYISIPLGLIGTVWVLLIAYVTRFMPFGLRAMTSTMVQIHRELQESARMCGASWLASFRRIVLPLAKSGFVGGWIFLSIIFLREVSSSILLYKSGSEVLSVLVFAMFNDNLWEAMSALGVMMTAITLSMTAIAVKLTRQRLAL